jgi:hypothetical protein
MIRREERWLPYSEAAQMERLWEFLRFWSLPPAAEDEDDVLDGTTYVLEAAHEGRYHVAHRDDPEWGNTFGESCDLLVDLSGFRPR